MFRVGDKLPIWKLQYNHSAYTDQFEKVHGAYVLEEEIVVTVVECRDVKGSYTDDVFKGFRATNEKGEEFFNCWDSFPEESMNPYSQWSSLRTGDYEFFYDARSFLSLVVTKKGERAIPADSKMCEKHKHFFSINDGCLICNHLTKIRKV